eukprot:scaffold34597_cov177-Amphora_coffeaeformis.AAC.19
MEALLDAAAEIALAAQNGQVQQVDLPMPEEYLRVPTEELLEIRDTRSKGKGLFARSEISPGTLLMVTKPVAMAFDWEDDTFEVDVAEDEDMEDEDGEGGDEDEPRLNEVLLIRILEKLRNDPGIWDRSLSMLFPRDANDLASLPAWVVKEDDVFEKVESVTQELQKLPDMAETAKEISRRLPHIIRYNILSVETCPELLSYPELALKNLSAIGLYTKASFFNHSRYPNCHRFAIGDVMFFVANQQIHTGDEVCISYIEHDTLQESAYRRNLMLSMNFNDAGDDEDADPPNQEEEGPQYPVVDPDLQNELMGMDPFERLKSIDQLMGQATGSNPPSEEMPQDDDDNDDVMETSGVGWFQCDVQNLRILRAITLEGLGQTKEALEAWEECVQFAETKLPPLDENSVVLRVQAALCAYNGGDQAKAKQHAQSAIHTHNLVFGGGVARFRRRLQTDFQLKFRPQMPNDPVAELWPVV